MIVSKNAKSLEESVYIQLEDEIISGKLRKGDTLTETALSERLGVSRTPLRAAMHRLAEEGLIETVANRGARVVGVSREDIVNIYEIRIRLEGLAVRAAAESIDEDGLSRLLEACELAEFYLSKNDAEHLKEIDTEFHLIIYMASANRHLTKILTELHRNIRRYRKLSISVPTRIEQSVLEHREIYNAIRARDGSLAERLTEQHVRAALDNLVRVADAYVEGQD